MQASDLSSPAPVQSTRPGLIFPAVQVSGAVFKVRATSTAQKQRLSHTPPCCAAQVSVALYSQGGEGDTLAVPSGANPLFPQCPTAQVSDALYSKVVKELCVSRGSTWSLKPPN